jgi:outer membrane protein assembly factor BamD (BamD/ComL family)
MMNAMKQLSLFTLVIALLVACGGGEKAASPSAELAGRIKAMEDSLFNATSYDQRKAQTLLDVYKAFAATHPLDSMAPEYLFRAAGLSKSMRDPAQSIFLYDRIITDYPSWYRLPDVFYLKAFTIDSDQDRKGEAARAYQEVINRYPDHPFAKDAKAMIENLQYTDEELIQRFEQMQQEKEAAAQAN